MSLRDLKKNRNSLRDKLLAEVEKIKNGSGGGSREEDNRLWHPQADKAGNAFAIIRFLPAVEGEDFPFIKLFNHGFQNAAGKWLVENCPTTVEGKCPICTANSVLWNSGIEKNKDIARSRKRKLTYMANILVIQDPANPENEGKVFLYKFGSKIFDKLNEAMFPQFKDEVVVNPFDFWDGANFRLKVRKVDGYTNYDKSVLDSPTPIASDDDEIDAIWKQEYPLKEFVEPKQFKSYADLEARFNKFLNIEEDVADTEDADEKPVEKKPVAKKEAVKAVSYEEDDIPEAYTKSKKEAAKPAAKPVAKVEAEEEDDDAVLSYLSKLADE